MNFHYDKWTDYFRNDMNIVGVMTTYIVEQQKCAMHGPKQSFSSTSHQKEGISIVWS